MNDWKKDERLKNISPEKLELLEKLASGIKGKTPNEAMPLLMAALSTAKAKGLNFTTDEMNLIINLLKSSASKAEAERIEHLLKVFHQMGPKF